MKRSLLIVVCVALAMVLGIGWPSQTGAQVILPTPDLPPEPDPSDCENLVSLYACQGLFGVFPGPIYFSDARHKCFQNVIRQYDGNDEIEDYDAVLDVSVNIGDDPLPATLTGVVTTKVFGKADNTTGTFDTEIVSMSLSGNVGVYNIELRESPTLASTGVTTITDLGGGLYHIDSFFDVFCELSVDYGPWMPQVNSVVRIVLVPASTVPVQQSTWGAIKSLYQ